MDRTLVIEPRDAVSHGMPPVRIVLDLNNVPFMARAFINPSIYAALVGPPGGILFFRFLKVPHAINDGDALEALIRTNNAEERNLVIGERSEMDVQGQRCITQLFFTGTSMAACANCAMIVPPPGEGASAPGLLLVFGHSGTPDSVSDCLQIACCEPLGRILETMQLNLAVDPSEWKSGGVAVQPEAIESAPPPRPAQQGFAPNVLLKFAGEIRETLKGMNCWCDTQPTGEMIAKWSPLQQRVWSLQATVKAMDAQLAQVAAREPNTPVFGIAEMFANWKTMFAGMPEASELTKLLERGPQE